MPQQTNELKSYMEIVIHCAFAMNMHKEFIFHALADEIRFPSQKLFFLSRMGKLPRRPQVGPWKFFFHGHSCDAWNVENQKELVFEFGPEGRIDTHTDFAFFRFVTTWPEYRQRSPFFQKERELLRRDLGMLWDFFLEIGLLCLADPQRFKLNEEHPSLSYPDISDEEMLYLSVSFHKIWSVSSVEEALSFFQKYLNSLPFQRLCSNLSLLP